MHLAEQYLLILVQPHAQHIHTCPQQVAVHRSRLRRRAGASPSDQLVHVEVVIAEQLHGGTGGTGAVDGADAVQDSGVVLYKCKPATNTH